MKEYINKTIIKAELERLIETNKLFKKTWKWKFNWFYRTIIGRLEVLEGLKIFLNTLEVKGVENTELLKVRGYLVRDKDDYTAIYAEKPHREKTEWVDGNGSCLMTINDARLVPDIEFEDEPVEVEVTLKRLNTGE